MTECDNLLIWAGSKDNDVDRIGFMMHSYLLCIKMVMIYFDMYCMKMRPNFSNIHRSPNELCILSMIIILFFSDLHGLNLGGSQPLSGQTAPQALKRTHCKILFKINQHIKNYITDTHLVIWASLWAECLNWLPSTKSNRNIPGSSNLHDGADQALQANLISICWCEKSNGKLKVDHILTDWLARPLLRNLGFKANLVAVASNACEVTLWIDFHGRGLNET